VAFGGVGELLVVAADGDFVPWFFLRRGGPGYGPAAENLGMV
jgi:hypothetical protein